MGEVRKNVRVTHGELEIVADEKTKQVVLTFTDMNWGEPIEEVLELHLNPPEPELYAHIIDSREMGLQAVVVSRMNDADATDIIRFLFHECGITSAEDYRAIFKQLDGKADAFRGDYVL